MRVGELPEVCSQIVLKCLYLDRIGRPDIMVSELFGKSFHEVEQSLCQHIGQVDFLHSSHEWIQTTLPRGKHSIIMQTWIVSWCWFCLISQTQNQRQAELCVFFGSHTFVPVGWSCKKTDGCISQWYRSRSHFLWTLVCVWMKFPAVGLWDTPINVLEPKAPGNLMRHVKAQRREAINRGSRLCSPGSTHPANVSRCSLSKITSLFWRWP